MKIDRALSCLQSGWAVFPLIPNSKKPLTTNGFKDASKDPEAVRRWWTIHPDANIGIATGMVSGIAVIDVDVKGGTNGFESLALIPDLDPTIEVTTPSGGRHYYCVLEVPLSGKNGYLPGIDIKSDGGYVVGPGSVIDGKEYEWVDPEAHLGRVPDSIIKRMAEKQVATPLPSQPGNDIIAEGNRNAELTSIAGTMRRRGLKADEIAAALKTVNTNRCAPPLPDPEVNSIAQSVARYAPEAPANNAVDGDEPLEGFSDDSLALAFSDKHGDDWRYVAAWSHWLNWDGTCWRKEDTLKAFDLARDICREASMQCEKPSAAAKAASANTVAAVEKLAKADRRHAARIDIWDRDPWLLNAKNGVVDLKTGSLRAHNRLDYLTKATTAGLATAGTAPTRWLEFLSEITGGNLELQAYLARLAGYSLTGITSEHAFAFFYGTGANGKSVFLNTLGSVLGDYATNAPIDTFLETRSERHPTDLAGLRGARLVTAIEVEKGRRFADSKLKSITGGDKVTARHIAARAKAPSVPGTSEPVKDADEILAFVDEHGLPIAIKAAFGGGGRGIYTDFFGGETPEALARRATQRMRALQQEADTLAARERTLLGDLRRLEVERDLRTPGAGCFHGGVGAAEREALLKRVDGQIFAILTHQ